MSQTTCKKSASGFVLGMLMLVVLISGPASAREMAAEVVGEVATVIGQGKIFALDGNPQSATRGLPVRAGDRVETGAGGHVHVRFVDGGLVSVRPLSRLLIESYSQGDARSPGSIKFRLEEGVVRSITGEWGEANRDRFRLNTPVAAIGVKGTDFVVKAGSRDTYASVFSGAIVMAPLKDACAGTLGSCAVDNAVTLSADMQGKMLQYLEHNGGGAPRLVPAIDLLARNSGASSAESVARRVDSAVGVDDKMRTHDAQAVGYIGDGLGQVVVQPLIWLHNPMGWNVAENTISERYDEARLAGRSAVAGNFFITLYRDESVLKTFQPVGASASFRLSGASAVYAQQPYLNRPDETLRVSSASLHADFANASFSTSLTLQGATLGTEQFQASGKITESGILRSTVRNGQNLAGALSTDALQAGYAFDKEVAGGKVSGLTLWRR